MTRKQPIQAVLAQIRAAKRELDQYPPSRFGWHKRCVESANKLVPWLTEVAGDLKVVVEEVVNSKRLVRETWAKIKSLAARQIPAQLVDDMDRELDREGVLLTTVGGDVVSKVIEKFLLERFPEGRLESNGRSDYPDLFLRSNDYEGLPAFLRAKDRTDAYGAALKGPEKRPVRVPDGLEIKTCRERFAVDCHHAHAGLHLVLLFHGRQGFVEVSDIAIGFLQSSDYRITKPSTPTTTLKASFTGKNFVSLLRERGADRS